MSTPADGFQKLLATLDRMEIRYGVGGSVASSVHGNYRYTNDVDVVVDIPLDVVPNFVLELGPEFLGDPEAIQSAFRNNLSYNVFHLPSVFKFDLFPSSASAFATAQVNRSKFRTSKFFGVPLEFSVISPEDILLAKLHWFHLGGETSEQQWKDITALLAIQGPNLDREYIKSWSEELQIAHLLNRLSLLP